MEWTSDQVSWSPSDMYEPIYSNPRQTPHGVQRPTYNGETTGQIPATNAQLYLGERRAEPRAIVPYSYENQFQLDQAGYATLPQGADFRYGSRPLWSSGGLDPYTAQSVRGGFVPIQPANCPSMTLPPWGRPDAVQAYANHTVGGHMRQGTVDDQMRYMMRNDPLFPYWGYNASEARKNICADQPETGNLLTITAPSYNQCVLLMLFLFVVIIVSTLFKSGLSGITSLFSGFGGNASGTNGNTGTGSTAPPASAAV